MNEDTLLCYLDLGAGIGQPQDCYVCVGCHPIWVDPTETVLICANCRNAVANLKDVQQAGTYDGYVNFIETGLVDDLLAGTPGMTLDMLRTALRRYVFEELEDDEYCHYLVERLISSFDHSEFF